ncbi:type I polyketide synthase [Streptomyces sp. B1866]|uniref:type I polyketide synthase n=1 Tax=Streptomyces sp. B1866 TaxID=3075431 RepID=UPI00288FB20B|nr:type I polyketide synthase [Streptomyces sp. B1866]MDT3397739.1 type I polyketide synthase [Streptomyces sp. B1866]
MAVEAVDDAGYDPASLAGSDTAVFVGCSGPAYGVLQSRSPADAEHAADAYSMSGMAVANTANRVSHFLDLRGPSAAVDTACSSALTAVHHACEALRTGRSRLALAAGVSLLLSPFDYVGFAAASMLSPTGRCRAFSADADGFARAEGGGLVVLKPLRQALADGDRVHAVILASGVNSDGRTQGLVLPSARAQEDLLREVYARAGVHPGDIGYVEAHGTGTPVGDPIECQALGGALGPGRPADRPLPIGSVKSNLGHLEAASGMPALLKAVLVLRHRTIPPTLHARPLSPAINFAALRLRPVTEPCPLEPAGRPVVGVNCFGFGGSNAHVVLAAPPPPAAAASRPAPRRGLPVVVSAETPAALQEAAGRLADRLDAAADEEFYDLAYTACRRRGHRAHRFAVLAGGPAAAARLLRERAEPGDRPPRPPVPGTRGAVAFVLSGNGSQWAGMGVGLLRTESVFRAAVEEADQALAPLLGWSVAKELAAPPERSRMHLTEVAQPALFAFQTGLAALLADHGIRPAAVTGHSVGEIAAAHLAGALDLPAAALVVAERSRAQAATAGTGGMAAVGLSEADARGELAGRPGHLEIAAVNSPADVTVSGDRAALEEWGRLLAGRGVFFRLLDIDHPFHSRAMDPLAGPLRRALAGLRPSPTRLPFVSCVSGGPLEGTALDAAYWWRNVREPVLFAQGTAALLELGCDILVELGPHPVLRTYLRRLADAAGHPVAVVPTLSRQAADGQAVAAAAADVLACGARADWSGHFPAPGRVADLPAYPWQRERHYHGSPAWWTRTCGDGTYDHPLLGERAAVLEPTWHQRLDRACLPWLADHRVDGAVLMPASGYVELALAAGGHTLNDAVEVTALEFQALALSWDDDAMDVWLQTSLSDEDGLLRVATRGTHGGPWRPQARGRVRRLLREAPRPLDPAAVRARTRARLPADELYARAEKAGIVYGPAFRVLDHLDVGDGEVLARFAAADLPAAGYHAHPAVLDGALQAGAPLLAGPATPGEPFLPASVDAVRAWRPLAATGYAHVRSRSRTAWEARWDVTVTDPHGQVCLELEGLRLRRYDTGSLPPLRVYTPGLRAAPRPDGAPARSTLPAPGRVLAAAGPRIARIFAADRRAARSAAWLAEATAHFTARALATVLPDPSAPFTADDLYAAGVRPQYAMLLDLLLANARDHGLAERPAGGADPARWRLTGTAEPERLFRELARRCPDRASELVLLGRGGRRLADVLRGRCDPLELLFSEPERHITELLYSSALAAPANHTARELVRTMAEGWPADRPLRVLEAGAGTGGTTACLLPVLPPDRTSYVFTDVSASFFPRARARFTRHDFVEYRTLDLAKDCREQEFAEGSFDLVVAANVLHATPDLRQSLDNAGRLLADGGHLLLLEIHDPLPLVLVFGLLDTFWQFTDERVHRRSPLLAADDWKALLGDHGFTGPVQAVPDADYAREHSVLLARRADRPAAPAPARQGRAEQVPDAQAGDTWILVADPSPGDGLAAALRAALTAAGAAQVWTLSPGEDTGLWPSLLPPDRRATVVLIADDGPGGGPPAEAATTRAVAYGAVLRDLAAACRGLPAAAAPALWLVTRPAAATPAPEPRTPAAAAVWGMTRSFANEFTELAVRRVALTRGPDAAADARRLLAEIADPARDDEIVLTPAGRFVTRVTDRPPAPPCPAARPAAPGGVAASGLALRVRGPGPGYRLEWRPTAAGAPGPGQIAVAVRATALNYRDVMQAQALLPPQPSPDGAEGHPTGFECAGVVTAVGEHVTGFAPGDRVYAVAPGCAATHVVTHAALAGPIPEGMDFAEAATLPIAFLTVQHALGHLARLAAGETLLVHGAAGGVGLAALQYARLRGARVIATAGTGGKRDLLHLLGVEHVLDSRTLTFAEHVRQITGGRGVDVVLNSLSGEAITRGLESLAPGGRFVELGKRDFYTNGRLLLRPFLRNLAFFSVDIGEGVLADPARAAGQFQELVREVSAGHYRPLPHHVHAAADAEAAYESVRHSRHVGKAVLSLDSADVSDVLGGPDAAGARGSQSPRPGPAARPAPAALRPDGTYLVTGGLGGLGGATAGWLVEHGARHLALVGRRGPDTPGAADLLRSLRARGARVTAHAADAADRAAMRALFDALDAAGHPVRGVVHAAMHLDDASLLDLTDDRLRAVLAPKMLGALVLDDLTRGRDTDLFVLYSSAAALIGNSNQVPYVGGNLVLESLARARRRAGEPALTVAWGAVGEIGYVARTDAPVMTHRRGLPSMAPEEVFTCLDGLLAEGETCVTAGRLAWDMVGASLPATDVPRLARFHPRQAHPAPPGVAAFRRALAAADVEQATALATEALAELTAAVLQTTADRVDPHRPLDQLGMDSLMAAELAVSVQRTFGCDLPAVELAAVPDLAALARLMVGRLGPGERERTPGAA